MTPPVTIALAMAGGLVAGVFVALLVWQALVRRGSQALEARVRAELETVRDQLAQVAAQGLRVANQQRALERQLMQLADRQGRLELRGEGRPFEQAIAMLRSGAARDELVARLGLSDSEAALLVQLHGARGPERNPAAPRPT